MMSFKHSFIRFFILLFSSFSVLAGDRETTLFTDISKQSHDYSCGPAALSTLINGTIGGPSVSEMDVILTRKKSLKDADEKGFTLLDLKYAAEKFGHKAQWRKIRQKSLLKISQPVILLIGLNSPFPHFVILKGFRNGEAFLADPVRGNIRVPYDDLVKDGISGKYPAWYVMAIDTPANPKQKSSLYLSDSESHLTKTHFTIEQSNAITLLTIARPNQVLLTYQYRVSQGRDTINGAVIKSRGYTHNMGGSYGIGNNAEIGGGISYSKSTYSISGRSDIETSNKSAYVSISRDLELADMESMGVLLGSTLSYSDKYAAFNLGVNALAHGSTDYGQWMAGGSFYQKLKEKESGNLLPKYRISWLLGINKPLSDRYLGSFYLTMDTNRNEKKPDTKFNHFYSANASLTWALNRKIQLRPSIDYSFGGRVIKIFSIGMEVIYMGGW
uniref:Peptidase C39 family protein n=1 Tax=Candidatus Kentrum sp. TUN TaxID=2126343 RepID=A0A450ZRX5_9GAMM|nr:MAG: Peptidase C39 family protein [Candidatus Kentron sp. TUN]